MAESNKTTGMYGGTLMKRWKQCVWSVLAGAAAVSAYDYFVLGPKRMETFVISPVSYFCLYAARPLFWLCTGILIMMGIAGKFTGSGNFAGNRKLCLVGAALVVLYGIVLAIALIPNPAYAAAHRILMPLTQNSAVFLIPGILIGASSVRK